MSFLIWIYILIFIKPYRIKQLLPVGILSTLILFCTALFFKTFNLYGFINPFLPVLGVPLFTLIWGFGTGIVVIHYMPREFYKKLVLISIFTVISRLVDFLALLTGYHFHNNFQWYHVIIQDFVAISFLVFLAEGIFGKRIKPHIQE